MRKQLINFYLDYVNNYLSVARMAEDNGIDEKLCHRLIAEGKYYHALSLNSYVDIEP